jgi:hypothetical protein
MSKCLDVVMSFNDFFQPPPPCFPPPSFLPPPPPLSSPLTSTPLVRSAGEVAREGSTVLSKVVANGGRRTAVETQKWWRSEGQYKGLVKE